MKLWSMTNRPGSRVVGVGVGKSRGYQKNSPPPPKKNK